MAFTITTTKPEQRASYVESGDYKLRLTSVKLDSSKSGNDMATLMFQIINPDGTNGPTLFDRLVFVETCIWKINQFLKACGQYPGEGIQVDFEDAELRDRMIGWECEANLKVKTYDGVKSNEIAAYLWDDEF